MPQIAQLAETFSSQIFWLLVFFGLVFFVIGRGMVPKVMATVSQREGQISGDLAAAQAARDKADAEEEAWRQRENDNRAAAHQIVTDAKDRAAVEASEKLAAAQTRIDTRIAEAEGRIATSRQNAMGQIETVAAEATQDIVRRLAGLDIAEPTARSAVRESL